MYSIKQQIKQTLATLFSKALSDQGLTLDSIRDFIEITPSTQAQFGHFQCNAAMRLAKPLKQNPRQIGEQLAALIQDDMFERVEVAGPGFINMWLKPDWLANALTTVSQDPHLGTAPDHIERIIVDFSSPNIAKEMHVGHLRSTIIGDAICRILEFQGHDVLRLNHVGDWGTAFGMLIVYLQEQQPGVLDGSVSTNLTDLVAWYKAAKAEFDADPDFKKRAQLQVVALQSGDTTARKAWQMICDISRQGFQKIYDILDVTLTERGESFYNDMLAEVIEDLEQQQLVTISDGAKCVYLDGFKNRDDEPLPLMVQKSDGGFNYASTDMAAVKHRAQVEKAKRIIYITDSGQSLHFQMVFAAAEKAGLFDPNETTLQHAGFGLVLGDNGKKFKTRSGETVRLQDLLDEAIQRAQHILQTRHPEWSQHDIDHAAKVLGIGAVKYADLSCNRINDYKFSFDRMLQFEGNTAAFIMYAYARIQQILAKSSTDFSHAELILTEAAEVNLCLELLGFADQVDYVAKELSPNRLTDYLYQLAQCFNVFYRDCKVVGSDYELSRLHLCQITALILKRGLELLGIGVLDKM